MPNINGKKIAMVISAFPGCGKSTFFKKYSEHAWDTIIKDNKIRLKVLDSDSSSFSWLWRSEAEPKIRDPKFPQNYIDHIKEHLYSEDIIFISSHDVVRKALKENNIPYVLIYPGVELKEEWINRFIERENEYKFIKFQDDNWEKFIEEMDKETYPLKVKFPYDIPIISEKTFDMGVTDIIDIELLINVLPEYIKYMKSLSE